MISPHQAFYLYFEIIQGSWRCDVNISTSFDDKITEAYVEIKHLSSFSSIKAALEFETDRQIQLLNNGESLVRETRGFNEISMETFTTRMKTQIHEYRYFNDPDIPVIQIPSDLVESVKLQIKESKTDRRERLLKIISVKSCDLLMGVHGAVEFFDLACRGRDVRIVANWITGVVFKCFNVEIHQELGQVLQIERFEKLLDLYFANSISENRAKLVIYAMVQDDSRDPYDIAHEKGWIISKEMDNVLETFVNEILNEYPVQLEKASKGKFGTGFFMGVLMKRLPGTDPIVANELFKKRIDEIKGMI